MKNQFSSVSLFFKISGILAWREFQASLRSPGIFIAITIAALLETRLLSVPIDSVAEFQLLVISDPTVPAFLACVVVAGIYAAIAAAACIIQEREKKTLRVLFFAPVDHNSLIFGKFLAQTGTGVFIVLASLVYLLCAAVLLHLQVSFTLISVTFLSILLISAIVAFGLLISVYSKTTAAAILLLIVTLVLMFGLQIAARIAEQLLPLQTNNLVTTIFPLINFVIKVSNWISPLSYLLQGLEAITVGSLSEYVLVVTTSLIYIAIFLALAWQVSRQRGVIK